MGAWGVGNFDNDTVLDWLYDLQEAEDISLISKTIDAVFDETYIDADVGAEALGAIEAIARLQGNFGVSTEYSEELNAWVKSHPLSVERILKEKAKKALELILGEKSELHELCEESDELDAWEKEVYTLKNRL